MIVPARTHIFINTIIPPNPFSNSQEHRGFAFFQRHTYSRLSPSFHSKFWDQLVLQACHHEPPVRHAVVALGSLHESFMLGGGGGSGSPGGKKESSAVSRSSSDTFAVKQYTNAIRLLTASPEKWSGDVTLMACVLFVYFEVRFPPLSPISTNSSFAIIESTWRSCSYRLTHQERQEHHSRTIHNLPGIKLES